MDADAEPLPRNANGKVIKRQLREAGWRESSSAEPGWTGGR